MSATRSWQVLRKDLRLGPRSPLLLWALVVPVLMTILIQGVFGDLFADEPRLGIVDEGDSAVAAEALTLPGVETTTRESGEELRDAVRDGSLDAGIVLPEGFDEAVRSGQRPPLEVWISGSSLPADRAVLTVAVLDLVRGVAGTSAPVDVETISLGEETLPLDLRLLPLLVLYAVAIPGGFVPAASLVEEKQRGTLSAVLASPASVGEVLLAKGTLGMLLGTVAGVVTLVLNDAWGAEPLAVLLAVVVGAVMMAQVGVLLGSWADDASTMFTAWKGGGLLLFLPVVFFIWPGLPSWPARFFPTYYFLQPAYAVSAEGASLGAVAGNLGVGAGICLALLPLVAAMGRRMERRLATGKVEPAHEPVPA